MRDGSSRAGHESTWSDPCDYGRTLCARWPRTAGPGSVDRGQKTAGGAIEGEASVLPRGALTETC